MVTRPKELVNLQTPRPFAIVSASELGTCLGTVVIDGALADPCCQPFSTHPATVHPVWQFTDCGTFGLWFPNQNSDSPYDMLTAIERQRPTQGVS